MLCAVALLALLVAPLAGAWIETRSGNASAKVAARSLPSRERGLKRPAQLLDLIPQLSLPSRERGLKLVGVEELAHGRAVAPLAGAWIETSPAP